MESFELDVKFLYLYWSESIWLQQMIDRQHQDPHPIDGFSTYDLSWGYALNANTVYNKSIIDSLREKVYRESNQ